MIHIEISKLGENIKQVLYRDESGSVIRDVCYNRSGIVITDELTEFSVNRKVLSSVIYGADSETIIAYRQFVYDESGFTELGFADYKLKNGIMQRVCRTESYWVEQGRVARCDWFDANDMFHSYEIFREHPDPEIGMCLDNRFFPNGEPIFFGDLTKETAIETYNSGWLEEYYL